MLLGFFLLFSIGLFYLKKCYMKRNRWHLNISYIIKFSLTIYSGFKRTGGTIFNMISTVQDLMEFYH